VGSIDTPIFLLIRNPPTHIQGFVFLKKAWNLQYCTYLQLKSVFCFVFSGYLQSNNDVQYIVDKMQVPVHNVSTTARNNIEREGGLPWSGFLRTARPNPRAPPPPVFMSCFLLPFNCSYQLGSCDIKFFISHFDIVLCRCDIDISQRGVEHVAYYTRLRDIYR